MHLDRLFRRKRRNAKALDPAYVAGPLAALLEQAGGEARIQRLEGATNAYVARVTFASGLDTAVRWWPWVKAKRKGAEHAHLAGLLACHEIPIPEFLAHDDSPATRRRHGGEATAERFIEAPAFDPPWPTEDIAALADLAARLHAVDSPGPGKPWRPVNEQSDLAAYLAERWEKCFALARRGLAMDGPEASAAEDLLDQSRRWVSGLKSFELVHGDLSTRNLFRRGPGALTLCDFGAMAFGCFERDLAVLEAGMFGVRSEVFATFLEHYFAQSPPGRAERWEGRRAFFLAFHHLEKAYSNVRRARKAKRGGRTTLRAQNSARTARRHWAAFTAAVGEAGR
jgi:hypothetical protein